MQNANFDENPHENERIGVILGCAIGLIACAKHRCTGGWLKLCGTLTDCDRIDIDKILNLMARRKDNISYILVTEQCLTMNPSFNSLVAQLQLISGPRRRHNRRNKGFQYINTWNLKRLL